MSERECLCVRYYIVSERICDGENMCVCERERECVSEEYDCV